MENITFETTQKNGVLLISNDGYCYTRQKSVRNGVTEYWICEQRGECVGRAITANNRQKFQISRQHNHMPNKLRVELRQLKNNMKQMAANAIGANTTTTILQSSLLTASAVAKARLPDINSLKRHIQRQRNKAQIPRPLPQNRNQIIIPDEFKDNGNSKQPEKFLFWDSGPADNGEGERILMFTTQRNLDFLRTCKGLLMDGTFKTIPPLFTQLFTIHGTRLEGSERKPGRAIPLVFLLLPDKTGITYERSLTFLGSILPGWEPERIMMDFERAAINAAQKQWPTAVVTGCYFHFSQSINRKIRELGLTQFYTSNVENAMRLKMITALAFVPPENVISSWEELMIDLQSWLITLPIDEQQKIDDFLAYFETSYIGKNIAGVRREPRVAAIATWNVRERTLEKYGRTDNEVEGFHMKVVHSVGAQFPNLWKFLKALQGIQAETEKLVEEMNSGIIGKKQRLKYACLAERMFNATGNWANKESLTSYLRGITHLS